ncbi:hypothetical protein QBC43DRAFT_234781 [Cladorrhinum sp. PSN259]|nr:hypothetical protein QBC43DRAFT_234781 [Cladorrhinum sp. PSN259]
MSEDRYFSERGPRNPPGPAGRASQRKSVSQGSRYGDPTPYLPGRYPGPEYAYPSQPHAPQYVKYHPPGPPPPAGERPRSPSEAEKDLEHRRRTYPVRQRVGFSEEEHEPSAKGTPQDDIAVGGEKRPVAFRDNRDKAPRQPAARYGAEDYQSSGTSDDDYHDTIPAGPRPSKGSPDTRYAQPSANPDMYQDMMRYIKQLEARVGVRDKKRAPAAINIQMFYCLDNGPTCLAEPEWVIVDGDQIDLKARFPVTNPDGYLDKKENISFAVYNYYDRDHQLSQVRRAIKAEEPLPDPEPSDRKVLLVSGEMKDAIKAFLGSHEGSEAEFPDVVGADTLLSPYTWWYHYRKSTQMQSLRPRHAKLMSKLTSWIDHTYGSLFDESDAQFQDGRVSNESLAFLIRPGDILVGKSDQGFEMGYLAVSRPRFSGKVAEGTGCWEMTVRSYIYAGEFFTEEKEVTLDYDKDKGEVEIRSLNFVPLKYCSPVTRKRLEARGETFWWCREKQLVSYEGDTKTDDTRTQVQRFMVDFTTYAELDPSNPYSQRRQGSNLKEEAKAFADGRRPSGSEMYLFPTHIPGFDLRRKTWIDLEVDNIRSVTWNEQAFDSLVADEDMKEMVLALVTNHLPAETGTDLIENKGNGLIMHLHGPPGTGKTLTAESVAEAAKKPLYPVTCGDIGTEPDQVEQNLSSVFRLGRAWDCVVLLDEAEVFLEQRTLQDLKRNALVSVFLRALEYYDGILILTTNNVKTFDEAFRSRIQLSLRYERLREPQRKQVWRNFVDRLEALLGEQGHESIDFAEVTAHLDELASHRLNGREIRNAITTGRQLARFTKEKMGFKHLKRAIGAAEKFDRYLAEVREGEIGEGKEGRYH